MAKANVVALSEFEGDELLTQAFVEGAPGAVCRVVLAESVQHIGRVVNQLATSFFKMLGHGGAPSASFERAGAVCCYGKEQLSCHGIVTGLQTGLMDSFLRLFGDFRQPGIYRRCKVHVHSDSQNRRFVAGCFVFVRVGCLRGGSPAVAGSGKIGRPCHNQRRPAWCFIFRRAKYTTSVASALSWSPHGKPLLVVRTSKKPARGLSVVRKS